METLFVLLVILAVTRMAGEASERLVGSALVGELIGGIGLGIGFSALGIWLARNGITDFVTGQGALSCGGLVAEDVIKAIADLGMFFLMLLAGMKIHPAELGQASKRGVFIGLGGLVVPFILGILLAVLFLPSSPKFVAQAVFIGTALSITAVPIAVKVLLDLGMLKNPVGQAIISAALIDDIVSLLILSLLTALIHNGELPNGAQWLRILGGVGVFILIITLVGKFIFPIIFKWAGKARAPEFGLSLLIVSALAFAVLAELLGLHFILGAFAAGSFFTSAHKKFPGFTAIHDKVSGCTYGLLAPIFFASIGMQMDFNALFSTPLFLAALIIVAIFGKVVGAGLPAFWSGFNRRESLAIGVGMSGRGAVELIIADIALKAGLFRIANATPIVDNLYSSVVLMALITTLIMPIALRRVTKGRA